MKLMLVGRIGTGCTEGAQHLADRWGAICFQRTRLMHAICHALVDGAGDLDFLLQRLFPDDENTVAKLRSQLLKYVLEYVPDERRQRQLYQQVVQIVQKHDPLAFETELEARLELAGQQVSGDKILVIDELYTLPAFEYFVARGFIPIKFVSPKSLARKRIEERDGFLPTEGTFDHETESDIDLMPCDVTINNDGTITQLRTKIDQALLTLGAARVQEKA